MSHTPNPAVAQSAATAQSAAATRSTPALSAAWDAVRIGSVVVLPSRAPDVVCVRAMVELGRLAPADVRVDVLPGWAPPPVEGDDALPDGIRLWSDHPLGHGRVVFTGRVPWLLAHGGFTVRVRAAVTPADQRAPTPVVRFVPPRPANRERSP